MIQLRPLAPEDRDRLFRWRREPEVARWMCGEEAATEDGHRAWFDAFLADPARRGWIIERDGRPVGFLSLVGLGGCSRNAEWGWYIGEGEARGRGAGRAAQALGLELAFGELGLEKVWAAVLADNETALKAQAAAGFRREGYLRRQLFKDGRFRDVVRLGLLAEEWRARREPLLEDLRRARMIPA